MGLCDDVNIFARLIRLSDMSMSEIKPVSLKSSEVFTYRIVHLAQEKPSVSTSSL